ncbi:hypothetical protein BCR36DRAFT_369358 [Piromyces finnis]|uniref:Cation/H+ exchanger transmembrane domain-containing protein n=1 Tax=Piromyces finnis TaxID=1754191 RepID=A0A1Y1VC72_9FUNG|nr:hypothetical protein BCR36DRAFT_369358 [Piromyces finnis]|eukprot:ORX52562.1 hypothetical protein BCR36DRAFT_369358 [Piromyces finnis]
MSGSGGIFAGENPIKPDNAISLLIVQILVVIFMTRILSVILVRMKQPRVIAEVLTGIVLGPSVLGNWQWFSNNIFPEESMPVLKAFSEFGLIFFMFLVGLELDTKLMKAHIKESMIISATGIIFPFLLSIVASIVLYNKFSTDDVSFTSYMLFIGVSMSITAFPVLARILSDRNLLSTKVGMTSISAAAVGDSASWVFLALVISIVNSSSSPMTCVYILLAGFAFAIFMMTAVKKIVNKLMELSSTREDLNVFMIFITFALILASSWITEAIGIHSIFGAFLTGLIIPNESGFAIKLTEKIEDIISVLFVPLYFAYSGLQTKLSALNSWSVWGMLLLVIAMACFGKIFFSSISARFCGLTWRESFVLGILMNTKGLVELIVLNIGREAGVIDDRVFAIMVIMAIVTTLITTPTVSALYHPERALIDGDKSIEELRSIEESETELEKLKHKSDYNVIICLFHVNFVSPMMNILQIINPYYNQHEIRQMQIQFNVTALRLTQLDERTSTFLMMADAGGALHRDPIYRYFQSIVMNRVPINWQFAAAKITEYPDYIIQTARRSKADLVILPWIPLDLESRQRTLENWLEIWSSGHHRDLIADVYNNTKRSAVAAFIDHGFGHFNETFYDDHPLLNKKDYDNLSSNVEFEEDKPKVFIPFMGGPDDREALKFVIKLSASKNITIHILRIRKLDLQMNQELNEDTVHSVKSDKSNFSNMIYMLPDDEETKKDDEFIKLINQYIKARGKLTLEAILTNQYNIEDATKYGIHISPTEKDHCDISEHERSSKKKARRESKIRRSSIFKKSKDKGNEIEGKEEEEKEEESEVDISNVNEKPRKRSLPSLLTRSRENENAAVANRKKAKEEAEIQRQQQLEKQSNEKREEDSSNDSAEESSSSLSFKEDGKPPLPEIVEEDHFIDNIIFEEVETTDPVKLAIKKCTEYGKHDLIIIGRTGAYRHHQNLKVTLHEVLDYVHSAQQTIQSESQQQQQQQQQNSNNPLSHLFYRRSNNPSRTSIPNSIHSQANSTLEETKAAADLKGFKRRQQILLGELGGNLMTLKNEVSSSIMVFRTVHKNVYED